MKVIDMAALGNNLLTPELMVELNNVAREYEDKFRKKEFTAAAGAGIVKATVTWGSRNIRISIDDKYFNAENKSLVEDLIPSAIQRAQDAMDTEWKEMLSEAGAKIQEIVGRLNSEAVDNQENEDPENEE